MPIVPLRAKSNQAMVPPSAQLDPRFLEMAAALMRKEGKLPSAAAPADYSRQSGSMSSSAPPPPSPAPGAPRS
jgi:hypothetical protein